MIEQSILSGRTAVNIAASVEAALASGRAPAGELLPPVRRLAAHLGVAGATVAAAYRLLQERGVVTAERRRGTRIRAAAPIASTPEEPLPKGVRDLATGNPDPALLPHLDLGQRLYNEELNDRELVRMARKQFAADGVPSNDIAVVSGALDGIERALREQLRPGDRVLVEDPCFTGVLDLLYALALVPVPVAVDDEGILPAALQRALRGDGAKALIVTPRAQNPTGAAMTERRARALRALLEKRRDILLIEDDHAGPVAGAPYVTLIDPAHERWVVVRSVSKSLGPDLRVALMAGDAQTIARVAGRQTLGIRWVSHILQKQVVALWRDQRVRATLAAAARAYAERRDALLRELAAHGIPAHGASGLNVWIPLAEEAAVAQALFQRGWAVNAGERYRIASPPAIRVTVAALTPRDAKRFAADLAEIVGRRGARA
jgi:DNA-binding transcriptional MocR family regulator